MMKELFIKPTLLTKIEFWGVTTLYAFVIFFFIMEISEYDDNNFKEAPYRDLFDKANKPYNFYYHYFYPQLIRHISTYIAILAFNFAIIPGFLKKATVLRSILLMIAVFVVLALLYGVTGTYIHGYSYTSANTDETDMSIFTRGLLRAWQIILVSLVYAIIKFSGVYLVNISGTIEEKYKYIRKEAIVATALWLVILLVMVIGMAEMEIIIAWLIVIPTAICLYLYSFYKLIPSSLRYNSYQFFFYALKCSVLLFITFFVFFFVYAFLTRDGDSGAGYSAFNSFFQLFVTVPVTWIIYKRKLKGNEEINVLQKELKRSSANIDFLRSQINPHFLFNALNTLYGTAIQENADRTSEGIQKLGDMMRFMLQENMQDKISLVREIDYLNNYISLQRLRTDSNPIVQIQTEIQESESFYQIAPMLLIPFVENAFKHGISFRESSHIRITLQIKEGILYFDVHNSKHTRNDNDPERDKSGIGLENVKHRLKLSYPNKHELIIHENSKEFFIHLTIQLSKFA